MKVEPGRIALLVPGDVQTTVIGPWHDKDMGSFEVSPGFVVHDGTKTPPRGPTVMFKALPDGITGKLTYRRERGEDVILVPVEAYGEMRTVRSTGC